MLVYQRVAMKHSKNDEREDTRGRPRALGAGTRGRGGSSEPKTGRHNGTTGNNTTGEPLRENDAK